MNRSLASVLEPVLAAVLGLAPLAGSAHAGAPVLPLPGQTVTWTSAMSPITFTGSATIPAGGSVLVDPGVTLFFNNFSRLYVDGTLHAAGAAGAPVVIDGQPAGWLVARGVVDLWYCTIDNTIAQGTHSRLHVADSTFTPSATVLTDIILGPVRVLVERSTVQMQSFRLVGEVLVRDVLVVNGVADLAGYVRIEGLVADGGQVKLYREHQRALVENLSVTGSAGAGLVLDGNGDFLIDGGVVLQNNAWPLHLKGAGLVPGSSVPASGNANDAILGFDGGVIDGDLTLPALGLPYVLLGPSDIYGRLTVEPGVTLQLGAGGRLLYFGDFFHRGADLRGLPGQPILLQRHAAGQPWLALGGFGGNHLFEHLVIDGATQGVSSPEAQVWLNDCLVQNCGTGAQPSGQGTIQVAGTRFLDNGIGARGDTTILSNGLVLDGFGRPNVFAGNGVAVQKGNSSPTLIPARSNWWNHASGPFNASANPTGQGDPVSIGVDASQFLQAEPDLSDTPPAVRLADPFFLADPGEVLYLRWTASDDSGIVSQDVLLDLKGGGTFDFQPVASGLAGDVREFAFVMPEPGFNVFARPGLLRVRATDGAGQSSFDEVVLHVSSADYGGTFALQNDLSGEFEPLERFPVCWTSTGLQGSLRVHLVLDSDLRILVGPAGNSGTSCSFSDFVVPYVSTDSARFAVFADGQGNDDEWYFSQPFAIRPDGMFGDAPPSVTLLAPAGGATFSGGATIDLAWSAADDEALHGFRVQASFNGGRTWHHASDELDGTATGYSWTVPTGITVPDLRLRVVAIDRQFQDSSDGAQHAFAIAPASPWTNLGQGLAGGAGVPELAGSGSLVAGAPAVLSLAHGVPSGSAFLAIGTSVLGAPFKGGVFVPAPDVVLGPLALDGAGALALGAAWPSGVPAGSSLWWQAWLPDPAGPQGASASNALRSTAP